MLQESHPHAKASADTALWKIKVPAKAKTVLNTSPQTPALAALPGSDQMKAQAQVRNPFHRLTTPSDVANTIYLLSLDEAAWVNGAVIRVDGGEHISGVSE